MSDRKMTAASTLPPRLATERSAVRSSVRRALLPVVAAATVGLLPGVLHAQTPVPTAQTPSDLKIVKGRILVRPKAGLSNTELDKVLKVHGGRRLKHLSQINVHVIELPAQANEMAVLNALRSNPHIKFAEFDVVMEPSLYVNDPMFGNQWHLPKVTAPTAWDLRTGSGITIAILDTGVDAAHTDLAAQLVPGWNTFDNNNNSADVQGHGTLVAGTAAAAGNNSLGVVGVSFGSRIMPIRVTDTSGYGYASTIAGGITWAADNGARVANISFQGVAGNSTIISAAQYMRSKGGVVVASAGNSGVLESYAPTDYMTLVGATDSSNNVTGFSSYGSFVDVAAPGSGIPTTARGGSYSNASGTSFSSPIVAGVYALMMSANSSLTPTQLDTTLFSTATDILTSGKDDKSGWGVANASAAVSKAMQTNATDGAAPSVTISSPAAGTKLSGLASVGVSAIDNIAVARTELYVNGSLYATETAPPFAFTLDTTKLTDGNATLLAKAFDTSGNAGTSASVAVTIANDAVPPVVAIQNPTNGSTVSGSVTVAASATDNQKVAEIRLSIDGKQVAISYGSSLSYSWSSGTTSTKRGKSKNSSPTTGSHTLTVVAKDAAGNQSTQSITVKTL